VPAFSVANILFLRARDVLRRRSQAAISDTLTAQHADLDFYHFQPTGMLGRMARVSFSVKTFATKQGNTYRKSTCTRAPIAAFGGKPICSNISRHASFRLFETCGFR
jgi:hypothetical protein